MNMPISEIEEMKDSFVKELSPLKIYLFGSFAEGNDTPDSDFDFYIVVDDNQKDLASLTSRAYKSIRKIKKRSVDILVGTEKRFDERKNMPIVENEVVTKGVLLYG